MKYEILQLDYNNINVRNDGLMYMPWNYVNEKFGFNHWNYETVYVGEIDGEGLETWRVLENIFRKFNVCRPSDFRGHSLSTSDVVVLNGVMYYCDSCGWVNVETGESL